MKKSETLSYNEQEIKLGIKQKKELENSLEQF